MTGNVQVSDEVQEDLHFIMHVDLDMFFAAVELRKNPTLMGEPVIVGNPNARITGKGVVLTCTYEARKFGISSGMSMFEALKRCPQAIIVPPSKKEYYETSKRVMNYLRGYRVPIRVASVDEAYMDITSLVTSWEEAYEIAWNIQEELFANERLTCSIGIAPTLRLAKIASDYDKPKGITIVRPEDLPEFFVGLQISKIPGIGRATTEKLAKQGITHCDQLIHLSIADLQVLFGSFGSYLYRLFRGRTGNIIETKQERKSISHESTFYGKPKDLERYTKIIDRLFQRTYDVLKDEKWLTKTVTVKIRFSDYKTLTKSYSFPGPTDNEKRLYEKVIELSSEYLDDYRGLRLIGIGFSNLVKIDGIQTSLLDFLK